ncbi:MAG TPA: HIT family protein [Nevskiaceae bacterium]|nr:HIT family protein [Nevskiaceae bacterium]
MRDCIFCKIAKGELPCYKIYEDKDFLGFLDINPTNSGQSLLIPKKHYRWADDIPNFGAYFEAAKKIGLAIKKALKPMAVCYVTLGFQVHHAHIRIMPRFENDGHEGELNFKLFKKISESEMKEIAEKIRKEMI